MGCVSCKKRSARINGLNLFQQRLASKQKTVNVPTSLKTEEREVIMRHKSPVSIPKISPQGWVVTCLTCGKTGTPQPFPELATSDNCNCEK